MRTLLTLGLLFLVLVASIVAAFTITPIGGGRYAVTFNDGRNGTVSNVSYDQKAQTLSFQVNMTDHKGLTMEEIAEAQAAAINMTGNTKKYLATTVTIK